MISHVVAWTLREDVDRDASIARVRELLTGLVGTVSSIRSLEVVENVAYPDKNSDLAVVATFDDLEGLDAYQVHPDHQAAAAEIRGLVTSRAAIDWQSGAEPPGWSLRPPGTRQPPPGREGAVVVRRGTTG